jgi:hypothetical protein
VRYLYLLNSFENGLPAPGSEEAAAMEKAWGVATDAMRAAGVLIDCAPLAPTTASTTVRVGQPLLDAGWVGQRERSGRPRRRSRPLGGAAR